MQPERTSLAWTRTAMALTVVSMTLLRWSGMFSQWVIPLILAALLCAVFISLTQQRRYRDSASGIADEQVQPNTAAVAALSLASVMIGIAAVVLMLV